MSRNAMKDLEDNGMEETEATVAEETTDVPATQLTVIDNMEATGNESSFSVKKNGFEATLAYDFGVDLATMVERFGEALVFSMAKAQLVVKAQAVVRPIIARGESAVEVIKSWVPGEKRAALPVDKKAATDQFVEESSLDELEELLAKIQAKKEALA